MVFCHRFLRSGHFFRAIAAYFEKMRTFAAEFTNKLQLWK